ncbi:FAD-dependent oxidoreductase (plasmid) [Pseudoalteromonas espejiana]
MYKTVPTYGSRYFNEVATGSIDPDLDGVVYSAHAAKHHYNFQLGTFCNIDQSNKTITLAPHLDELGHTILPKRTVRYDHLVIAIGGVANDFNTPGIKDHCYFLDSNQQAERFSAFTMTALPVYTKTITNA